MIRTAVIAIGGNSLITDKEHQRVPDQYQACSETCRHIAPLLRDPNLRLVITHGNGPQVGFILRRSELAAKELHTVPLDSCVADTQDHASSLLARELGAALFVISTGVATVCLDFGTPHQQEIDRMTVADARRYMAEGHFNAGSMLPKIEAVIDFLGGGGAVGM